MIGQEKVLIITTHSFWGDPLGNGTLIRKRYEFLREIFGNVLTLYITDTDKKCPLPGGTIKHSGSLTDEVIQSVRDIVIQHDIKFCYFSYVQSATLVRALPTFNMVEIHDVLHLRQQNFENYGYEAPVKIDKASELEMLSHFDLVLSINLNESTYLRQNGISAAIWFPPTSEFLADSSVENRGRVSGFLGSNAIPNVDGINCLSTLFMDLTDFHLAGPISLDKNLVPFMPAGTIFHGVLNNISNFYNNVDVALSPIRFGGGLKIKVFEALSFGVDIIATKHSVEGFPTGITELVTVDDCPRSWSGETVSQSRRVALELKRDFFLDNFSHERGVQRLRDALP